MWAGVTSPSADTWFLRSAVLLLSATALSKVFSAGGAARVMDQSDPLLILSGRQVLLAAGLVEFAVVAYLLSGKNKRSKYLLVIWLSLDFVLYRLFVSWAAPGKPCPCLGTVGERLPFRPQTTDLMLKLIIGYLLAGAIFFLVAAPWRNRRYVPPGGKS